MIYFHLVINCSIKLSRFRPLDVPEPVKPKSSKSRKSDPNYLKKKKEVADVKVEVTNEMEEIPGDPPATTDLDGDAVVTSTKKSKSSDSKLKSHKKHKKKDKKEKKSKKEKAEKVANDENLLIEME